MSRRYYNKRASDLKTGDIVEILVQIDNGLYDPELENRQWYGKVEVLREELIEVLWRRYRQHYSSTDEKDEELENAYRTYLKYYLK